MFQGLGRHVAKGSSTRWRSSEVSRSSCNEVREKKDALWTGAIWFRRTPVHLISLALPLVTRDYNPQQVTSISKNLGKKKKSYPSNIPIKFTPET